MKVRYVILKSILKFSSGGFLSHMVVIPMQLQRMFYVTTRLFMIPVETYKYRCLTCLLWPSIVGVFDTSKVIFCAFHPEKNTLISLKFRMFSYNHVSILQKKKEKNLRTGNVRCKCLVHRYNFQLRCLTTAMAINRPNRRLCKRIVSMAADNDTETSHVYRSVRWFVFRGISLQFIQLPHTVW